MAPHSTGGRASIPARFPTECERLRVELLAGPESGDEGAESVCLAWDETAVV
ncbi:hypothetical protein [Streptomyces sp. VB1]|uniref:hypothetical protein n=1 Tax=Streptomyces sp. VB1 TaxID=2986803 RepID=UPI002ADD5557|nr:hypothetical protein [Streptomyces sp. VB1]